MSHREAIFCVGEVLGDAIEKFAIAGFSSNTRRSCRFTLLKTFTETWLATRGRLGTIEPCGYTRIGPALRHAQELLAREPGRRKLILLITDGRPCDYDRYEGTYGIKDVKKAIETGRQNGIQTHAFAVEKQAAEYFPAMFTQHATTSSPTPPASPKPCAASSPACCAERRLRLRIANGRCAGVTLTRKDHNSRSEQLLPARVFDLLLISSLNILAMRDRESAGSGRVCRTFHTKATAFLLPRA